MTDSLVLDEVKAKSVEVKSKKIKSVEIARGRGGLVYHPPLLTTDETLNKLYHNDNYIMRIGTFKEGLMYESVLEKIDPEQKYFLRYLSCIELKEKFPDHPERRIDGKKQKFYGSHVLYGGENMANYNSKKLKLSTIRNMYRTLKEGLHLLHTAGLTHNDIHTENIVIDAEYNARFIDFEYGRYYDERDAKWDVRELTHAMMEFVPYHTPNRFKFYHSLCKELERLDISFESEEVSNDDE